MGGRGDALWGDIDHREGLWAKGQPGRGEPSRVRGAGEPEEADGEGEELAVDGGAAAVPLVGVLEGCGCGDGAVYDLGGSDAA